MTQPQLPPGIKIKGRLVEIDSNYERGTVIGDALNPSWHLTGAGEWSHGGIMRADFHATPEDAINFACEKADLPPGWRIEKRHDGLCWALHRDEPHGSYETAQEAYLAIQPAAVREREAAELDQPTAEDESGWRPIATVTRQPCQSPKLQATGRGTHPTSPHPSTREGDDEVNQKLTAAIDKFLAERRKSDCGGWADVTDDDLRLLSRVIDLLIFAKCECDADGDFPIRFELVNRRTHRMSCFMPMPNENARTVEAIEPQLEIALFNSNVAHNELDAVYQMRRLFKSREKQVMPSARQSRRTSPRVVTSPRLQEPTTEAMEQWLEFLSPTKHSGPHGPPMCGLCANHGRIRISGLRTSAGYEVEPIDRPCICPNGRAIKTLGGGDA